MIFNNGGIDLGLVSALLEAEECTVYVTSLPLEAIHILRNSNIDLILASARIEGMEGEEFKEMVEKISPGVNIFLLPLTSSANGPAPAGPSTECTLNLKEFVYFIQNHIKKEKTLVDEASRFKDFFFAFTDRLLQIFEVNDKYFFNNNHLVAELSQKIAIKMGLDDKLVDSIHLAALLRDIGKIGIHHEILTGKTRLERGPMELVRSHPLNTVQILRQINFPWNVEFVIRHHHEHYDGNGYPEGLKGRNIPLGSRIIALADSYVAMTTERPYRKAMTEAAATHEIMKMAGSQFDPEVVEVFFEVLQQKISTETVRKWILFIDDVSSSAAYVRLNLGVEDLDLFPVSNIADARESMENITPAIIIAARDTLQEEHFKFYNSIREGAAIPFIIVVPAEELETLTPESMVDFIARPIDMDILVAKIRKMLVVEPHQARVITTEGVMKGVSGSLEDMGITDIIQVLNMGMKTARVLLQNARQKGELYLQNGRIVYVELGELKGHDAFFELIGWSKGEFRIFHGQSNDKVNVTMDTMMLLLEASKALDDKRRQSADGEG